MAFTVSSAVHTFLRFYMERSKLCESNTRES